MSDLLRLIACLVLVLGGAWLLLRLIARLGTRHRDIGRVRHLGMMAVGRQERLLLIDYEEETLLIGVTAGSMSLLDRRPSQVARADDT